MPRAETQTMAVDSIIQQGRRRRNRYKKTSSSDNQSQQHEQEQQNRRASRHHGPSGFSKRRGSNATILSGLTLAVSTLDVAGQRHDTDSSLSYKMLREWCLRLGAASVSGQVHRRVFAVLCTESSLERCTQRIRKALKKGIPLVHAERWLKDCEQAGELIRDLTEYRMDEVAKNKVDARQQRDELSRDGGRKEGINTKNGGWSDPVSYGCCCICHDQGVETESQCPWCTQPGKECDRFLAIANSKVCVDAPQSVPEPEKK